MTPKRWGAEKHPTLRLFEKSAQKLLDRFVRRWPRQRRAERSKSFFASFFSKKEVLTF
jgi:hypothetical protein